FVTLVRNGDAKSGSACGVGGIIEADFQGTCPPMAKPRQHKRPQPQRTSPGQATALPRTRADLVLRLLSLFGLLLTAYLAWTALAGDRPAFCTSGAGCDVVQGSAWSRFLGMPIALWGLLLYAALAWVAWRPATRLARWRRL